MSLLSEGFIRGFPLVGSVLEIRQKFGIGMITCCIRIEGKPTAEFAGMNIEGAVKLGYRPVLAAIEDPDERKAAFDLRVAEAYETARAVNAGSGGGIDDVIDPADTRRWISNSLKRLPPPPKRDGKKYPYIDTW